MYVFSAMFFVFPAFSIVILTICIVFFFLFYCQGTTFSNPVYESVYRSETSLGSEVFRENNLPKVEFRKGKVDFSNPVYEALLAHNTSRKPGSVFWGSAENVNGEAAGDQVETDCL